MNLQQAKNMDILITARNPLASHPVFIDLIERYNDSVKSDYKVTFIDQACFDSFYSDSQWNDEFEIPSYMTTDGNPTLLDCSDFSGIIVMTCEPLDEDE